MLTPQQQIQVEDMYCHGLNPEDIADELGLDETDVLNFCADILDKK